MAQKEARGTLTFIGLGLHDDEGISIKGLKELESAEIVFAEAYTSMLSSGSIARLERRANKQIRLLTREEVEEGSVVLGASLNDKVALLIAGDPMKPATNKFSG